MRQIRYSVAASLDGYIAGPKGEYDWIPMDPDIDFTEIFSRYGAIVMGRRSYEQAVAEGGPVGKQMPTYVYSRTLPEGRVEGVTFVSDGIAHARTLREEPGGRAIWLWGGGELFRELADAGLVDGLDIAIVPVLLGGGKPMLAPPASRLALTLTEHRVYPKTGTLFLQYDVVR
jgi:dihydrofolate reductase